MNHAGARHLFARAQGCVREERKKTIAHEPGDIRAIACGNVNGITKREQVFHVSIVEQRVCACFTENGGGQSGAESGRARQVIRGCERRLTRESRDRREPVADFGL